MGLVELSGAVSAPEIVACFQALFGTASWVKGWPALWDARTITSLVMVPEDLIVISECKATLTGAREGGRSAVVTVRPTDAEIALLVGRYREEAGRPTRIFRSMGEAYDFLDRLQIDEEDDFVEVAGSDDAVS